MLIVHNRTPAIIDLGEKVKDCWLDMQLKLMADARIVEIFCASVL